MKKPLMFFLLSLVALTAIIAVNRWDIPVVMWLFMVFSLVALFSGMGCLTDF